MRSLLANSVPVNVNEKYQLIGAVLMSMAGSYDAVFIVSHLKYYSSYCYNILLLLRCFNARYSSHWERPIKSKSGSS